MSPKPKEPTSDLLSPQTTSAVAGGIDCEQLFALMTQQLTLVVDTRRSGKLYSLLQKELEAPTDSFRQRDYTGYTVWLVTTHSQRSTTLLSSISRTPIGLRKLV